MARRAITTLEPSKHKIVVIWLLVVISHWIIYNDVLCNNYIVEWEITSKLCNWYFAFAEELSQNIHVIDILRRGRDKSYVCTQIDKLRWWIFDIRVDRAKWARVIFERAKPGWARGYNGMLDLLPLLVSSVSVIKRPCTVQWNSLFERICRILLNCVSDLYSLF